MQDRARRELGGRGWYPPQGTLHLDTLTLQVRPCILPEFQTMVILLPPVAKASLPPPPIFPLVAIPCWDAIPHTPLPLHASSSSDPIVKDFFVFLSLLVACLRWIFNRTGCISTRTVHSISISHADGHTSSCVDSKLWQQCSQCSDRYSMSVLSVQDVQ